MGGHFAAKIFLARDGHERGFELGWRERVDDANCQTQSE
jgi:hypothetical protein